VGTILNLFSQSPATGNAKPALRRRAHCCEHALPRSNFQPGFALCLLLPDRLVFVRILLVAARAGMAPKQS